MVIFEYLYVAPAHAATLWAFGRLSDGFDPKIFSKVLVSVAVSLQPWSEGHSIEDRAMLHLPNRHSTAYISICEPADDLSAY